MASGSVRNDGIGKLVVGQAILNNQTINANSSIDFTINVAKTGYTAIGVVGYTIQNGSSGGTNSTLCVPLRVILDTPTNVIVRLRNSGGSAAKVYIGVNVLYKPN